jgi:multiple sugar transport system permease protein
MSALPLARGVAVRRSGPARAVVARWARFALLLGITAVVLTPLTVVVTGALVGRDGRLDPTGLLLQLLSGPTSGWLLHSVGVSVATVAVTTAVAAPAGYALSRARGRAVDASSLLLLGLQSLPAMVLLPALFVLLVHVGGGNSLPWLVVLYVGFSVAVATWTMRAFFDTLPVEIEEAAWLDGCSVAGAFRRVLLPNAAPALLSTSLITFLFAWNEYWIALLFIQDQRLFTVGLALVSSGRTSSLALVALVPPVVVYLVLHRWFRFGGVAGALSDR